MKRRSVLFAFLISGGLTTLSLAFFPPAQAAEKMDSQSVAGNSAAELRGADDVKKVTTATGYSVPPPIFSEEIFPCSECHAEMEPNLQRRNLEDMHTDIILLHGKEQRWCLDCHNPNDRDQLRLVSGEGVPFSESYRLCGQCHGDKLRDWKVGVHGKRTGYWNGDKEYPLCTHCHNPHDPKFKPLKPMPPPERPGDARHE